MINILTGLMVETNYSEGIDEALPILKQLQLFSEDFEPDGDGSYSDNVQEIVNKLHGSEHPSVFRFDSECIENPTDYADLTQSLFACAGMSSAITKMKSDYHPDKEKAGLIIKTGETVSKEIWNQTSDYVAPEYFSFIDKVLDEQFNKKLLTLPTGDQTCQLLVVTKEHYEPLQKFFTLADKGVDEDDIYSYRVWMTILVTVVGFVVTPFIGWYFFGFWMSVLYSFVFWAVFGAYKLYKAASAAVEYEKEEKLKQEDPALYAQNMMMAMMGEAAKREKNSPAGKRLQKVIELRQQELDERANNKAKDPA